MIVEPLPWCEPAEAASLLRPLGTLAFLDSAMRHERLGRYSYVAADPFGRFTVDDNRPAWNGDAIAGPPLSALKQLMARFTLDRDPALPPFQGGAIGTFSYTFGACFETLPRAPDPPWGKGRDVDLPFYDVVLAFDHATRTAWLISSGLPKIAAGERRAWARIRADRIRACLAGPHPRRGGDTVIGRERWRSNFSRETYRGAVSAVIEAILDGEIFQANIAQRFLAETPPGFDPWRFYERLRQVNPAPFSAFLDQGTRIIASSSPELFATVRDERVETRPIKGTARRVEDGELDRRIAARLLASEKDRAENMMIVDLLRNDLSRVCRLNSIETPLLCGIETYAGVHHLVSSVTGRLQPGLTAIDLIAASFPGGSVTGAPKPQAMRVITRIEGEARGVYCGSIAALGFDGSMSSNIAIRTVTIEGGRAVFQAGGGITALSDPDAEYQETLDKAERIFQAFERPGCAAAA